MRPFGWAIAIAGLIYMVIAFNMDVSVSTQSTYIPGYGSFGGGEVANFDLMAKRQNHLIVAGVITLIGSLMVILGEAANAPSQSASNTGTSNRPIFEGERNISQDPYRLWLADEYEIKRNVIFDRFVIGDMTFDNLDAALLHAHDLEVKKEAEIAEKEREKEELRIKSDLVIKESEEQWQRDKPKFIGFIILTVIALSIIGHFLIEKANKDAERLLAVKKSQLEAFKKKHGFDLPVANVARIGPIGPYDAFLCAEKKDGTLIEFAPETLASQLLPALDAALGDHQTKYEYQGSGEWSWAKANTKFILIAVSHSVTLCITK